MSVLVATGDGYHIFTSAGKHFESLGGHRIEALAPGPDGTWLGIVDHTSIWQHAADGTWSPLASVGADDAANASASLTAVVTAGDAIYAGTSDARVLRLTDDGALAPVTAFDAVAGRDTWHAVGIPLQVRSMTATADAGALLVNVHVGGIPRSVDGGATWHPTIAVDDDVHQVLAHPSRPEVVVAAASVGLCRSADGGATWSATTNGMHHSYARAVAILADEVLISVSDGPGARRSAIYRARVDDGGPVARVQDGLPDWLDGNVDTACLVTDGRRVALVDGGGTVWQSAEGSTGWDKITEGLRGVTAVAVA